MRFESTAVRMVAARVLGGDITVQPVGEGISTYIYRLERETEVYYLHVLPEEESSFSPESAAHAMLRKRSVRVPEIVYWEDRNAELGLAVMITTEIVGHSIARGDPGETLRGILRAAGQDLALINRVPVDGFGWIVREGVWDGVLRGELRTESEFMLEALEEHLAILGESVFDAQSVRRIWDVIHEHMGLLDAPHAHLAHGDFDVTHIYCRDGQYTGIIDFGEIRGTGPYYDLGHFRFHDGESLPGLLLAYLLEGYQEVTSISHDADVGIALTSLLIGVRFLARGCGGLSRHRLSAVAMAHAVAAIARDVELLAG